MTKKGSSFDMRIVIHRGRVSIGDFCDRGSVYEGCSEDFCIFPFHSILDTLSLVHWSCDHLTYIVFIFELISIDVCYSPISPCVVSFLSLCT